MGDAMGFGPIQFWFLVIAAAALSGWWLSVRPRATYSNISSTMSVLIVLMAVLLCVLAVRGQWGLPAAARTQSISAAHASSSGARAPQPAATTEP